MNAGAIVPRLRCLAGVARVFWAWPAGPARRKASAALEFAMASPLLFILLGGAADLGLGQFYRANLANALGAGAGYATLTGIGVTTANITAVITDAMFLPPGAASNLAITYPNAPGWYCVVASGTTNTVSAVVQSATCSDGSSPGYYLQVSATYTNTGLMNGFGGMLTLPITDSNWVRVQ